MTVTVQNIAANVAADIKALRSSEVTSEGKRNTSARSMLAALVSKASTPSLLESVIIHAFGNPKSPKSGKPIAKLSGLRDFNGGDAVRKAAETCFKIFENIDVDMPVTDTETNVTVGAGAVRPLIVGFILGDADAPKSLRALNESVSAAVKAHAKAISPDNADATAETDAETEAATADDAPATMSLVDRINALSVALSAASDDDFTAAFDAFNAMVAVSDARLTAMTDSAPIAVNG